jgi:hypothetical protein
MATRHKGGGMDVVELVYSALAFFYVLFFFSCFVATCLIATAVAVVWACGSWVLYFVKKYTPKKAKHAEDTA